MQVSNFGKKVDLEVVVYWVIGIVIMFFNGGDKGDGGELGKVFLVVKLDGVIYVGRMLVSQLVMR